MGNPQRGNQREVSGYHITNIPDDDAEWLAKDLVQSRPELKDEIELTSQGVEITEHGYGILRDLEPDECGVIEDGWLYIAGSAYVVKTEFSE